MGPSQSSREKKVQVYFLSRAEVGWVSEESVRFVGFTPVYGKEETGKKITFREILSTNHVI